MELKKIKRLKVNSYDFAVVWDKALSGGSVSYKNLEITIGLKSASKGEIFETVCHELMELCAMEMHVRFDRPDCTTDYVFVYDHRQHDTMINMFAGLVGQFIK